MYGEDNAVTKIHLTTYTFKIYFYFLSNGKLNKNIEDVRVVAGTERTFSSKYQFLSESKRNIRHYWRHKKFDRRGLRNDIGVLEVITFVFEVLVEVPNSQKVKRDDAMQKCDIECFNVFEEREGILLCVLINIIPNDASSVVFLFN